MPRGSSGGGSRSGGTSSGGRSQSRGPSSSSGRSGSQKPTGQVRNGKAVQYSIKSKDGQTKYTGSTNNPTRRAAEHRKTGKLQSGEKLEVQSRPISRQKAEQLEAGRLKGHRQEHGSNPPRNTTGDGKYHPK